MSEPEDLDGDLAQRYSEWDDDAIIEETFIALFRTEHAFKMQKSPEMPDRNPELELASGLRTLAVAGERDLL